MPTLHSRPSLRLTSEDVCIHGGEGRWTCKGLICITVVLTTMVPFVVAQRTVSHEVTKSVEQDCRSLVTVVLTLQCNVGAS